MDAFRVLVGQTDDGDMGTLTMTGGTLATDKVLSVGGFEPGASTNGIGVFNQSGGDVLIGNITPGVGVERLIIGDQGAGQGTYNLSGTGTLDAPMGVHVGAGGATTGTIVQTGGQITSAGILYVGIYGTGSYTLEGGTFTTSNSGYLSRYSGSTGTIMQLGGAISVAEMTIADSGTGTYTMTDGTLTATGRLFIGRNGDGSTAGHLDQSAGTVTITDIVWVGNINQSNGTYSLSGDAVANLGNDLNICAAAGANGSAPAGAAGTINIIGEDVTLTVAGNLVATGASVDAANSALFNFTTSASGGVSTIAVGGSADIDGAVFDIYETNMLPFGSVLDLVATSEGVNNLDAASIEPNATGSWILQLGGSSNEILQAVKVPEPATIGLLLLATMVTLISAPSHGPSGQRR